jgi:choline dehydrogenase-like flavoprotein
VCAALHLTGQLLKTTQENYGVHSILSVSILLRLSERNSCQAEDDPTRSNLDLYTFARVSRVIFAKSSPLSATGVEFVFPNGSLGVIRVAKEVIISAGTVKTPQVLELSGIGDPSVLKPLGIDVLYENAGVGANLQDHPITNSVWSLKPQFYFQSYTALELNATFLAEVSGLLSGLEHITH